jgi:transcriptional regulator with GAF, ATPase, and Fis domain
VLLQGESGTGKEVVAGLLHRLSRRRSGPFIKINCAALPESLLESELFGHTKGAFTGANSDREGVFHAADGGTLLLDEIGEISRTFQPKLLRVLQDGEFHRVGDARRSIKVNVRVIAATNRNLPEAVRTGEFREDLYYRLNVVPLHMPPLRDRIEDLPELLDHFRADLAESRDAGAPELSFSKEATAVMRRYAWPGNIRELVNLVEYAMVLADGPEVTVADLPVALQDHERQLAEEHRDTSTAPAESGETLEGIEMHCIVQAMQKTGFNRTRAAGLLGVTRRTLGYRINKYKLDMKLEELRRASEQSRQTSVSTLH